MTIARLLVAVAALASAAANARDHDVQIWNTVSATKAVSPTTDIVVDISARYFEDASYIGQFLFRTGVTRKLGGGVSVTGGYIYSRNDRSDAASELHEHRAWEQVQVRLLRTRGGFELTTRTRLEQRFLQGERDVALRFRQQLRAQLPLGKTGVGIAGSYEILAEANGPSWGPKRGIEQLRTYAGLTLPIDKRLSADLGYLNIHVFRRGENRVNDIATLTLSARF